MKSYTGNRASVKRRVELINYSTFEVIVSDG